MTDLSMTIAPKSDQTNADDLIAGPRTITVTRVTGNEGAPDQPISIHYEGDDGRPFKPCKSMRRVLVQLWGPDGNKYVGRSMTLYRDPGVKFGGIEVGGIRISHMTDIAEPMILQLTASKAQRRPYRVEPLLMTPKVDVALYQKKGRAAAEQGVAAFTEWWNEKVPEQADRRAACKAIMPELQAIARAADAAKTAPAPTDEEDPMGGSVVEDDDLTVELRADLNRCLAGEDVDAVAAKYAGAPMDAAARDAMIAARREDLA